MVMSRITKIKAVGKVTSNPWEIWCALVPHLPRFQAPNFDFMTDMSATFKCHARSSIQSLSM